MPNIDKPQNSDMYQYPDYSKKNGCKCGDVGIYLGPACPPFPPMPPDYPYPPCPPCPPPPFPPFPPFPPQPGPEPEPGKSSKEAQICKLSKKAAMINRMLENLETKKKDVIIKVGDTSFNFGNIDAEIKDWADGSYAATVKTILEHQRSLIQAQIKELADELDDDEVETTPGGIEEAITG